MDRTCNSVLLLLFCCAIAVEVGATVIGSQLEYHLSHFTDKRYPGAPLPGAREAAATYIKDQFREYGLEVQTHSFNTSFRKQGFSRMISGENIIGVCEGSGKGPVLLVGADYDNGINRNPLEDNGVGVAVMLEAARKYMNATAHGGSFTRNATVIFVAFDLNTLEYNDGAAGQPGSYHFLHQWLWPHLNQSMLTFGGAIILDSISRFDQDSNTQYLPEGFSQTFPQAFQAIKENNMRANFLALVTRGGSQSTSLAQAFYDNYTKHRKTNLVPLHKMILESGAPVNDKTLDMINHQAHYQFWTFQPSDKPSPLPAILITDTDHYRRSADVCYPPCTAEDFLTRRRQNALSMTTQGLVHTLLHLQAERTQTNEGSGSASVGVTVMATWLMAGMAVLLH